MKNAVVSNPDARPRQSGATRAIKNVMAFGIIKPRPDAITATPGMTAKALFAAPIRPSPTASIAKLKANSPIAENRARNHPKASENGSDISVVTAMIAPATAALPTPRSCNTKGSRVGIR